MSTENCPKINIDFSKENKRGHTIAPLTAAHLTLSMLKRKFKKLSYHFFNIMWSKILDISNIYGFQSIDMIMQFPSVPVRTHFACINLHLKFFENIFCARYHQQHTTHKYLEPIFYSMNSWFHQYAATFTYTAEYRDVCDKYEKFIIKIMEFSHQTLAVTSGEEQQLLSLIDTDSTREWNSSPMPNFVLWI